MPPETTNEPSCAPRIPFYSLEGTHYDYSFKLGQLTGERIRERIEKDSKDLQPLFDYVKTDRGSQYLHSYTTTIRNKVPWYYDEFQGLCDGSQVPLEQILVLNYKNELKAAKDNDDKKEDDDAGRTSCSTVLLNRIDENERLMCIAHNEDETDANWNTCFILQATIHSKLYQIDGTTEQKESPEERFIALGYAGQVAGNGFAINRHGFVFTYNGLYAKLPLMDNCLPRQLHNRLVLTVENEKQLERLMKTTISAYGFNMTAGRFRSSEGPLIDYLSSYEIGPSKDGGETNECNINYVLTKEQILEYQISQHNKDIPSASFALNFYCHFNHYIHLRNISEEQKPLSSSKQRTKRAEEYGELATLDQTLQFLGDEKYKSTHPVYRRSNTGKTNKVTLCTAIIDLKKSQLYVYDDNPKTSSPFFRFDLNSL